MRSINYFSASCASSRSVLLQRKLVSFVIKKSRSTPAPRIHTQFHAHSIIVVVFRFLLLYFLRPYTCTCCNNTSSSLTFPPRFISYFFCRCSMFLNYTPYFPYVNRIFNFFSGNFLLSFAVIPLHKQNLRKYTLFSLLCLNRIITTRRSWVKLVFLIAGYRKILY